jgi:pimeloyl-ACP methyl ester carboxylesterase
LLVLLILVGATYQGVTTSLERRRFPHPGRLVDVGSHQLHIHCTGRGMPVVVLEAPAGGLSASWTRVQEPLARVTRVCSYDRSGLGWSERGDDPYDPAHTPDELRALLDGARERPPFIVVGDGLGAAFARAFAARFDDVTEALVLLDAPDASHQTADHGSLGRLPNATPWLARVGLLRAAPHPPDVATPALRAFMNRPDHLTRAALEIARWDETVRLSANDVASARAIPTVTATLPAPVTDERGAAAATTAIGKAIAQARRSR